MNNEINNFLNRLPSHQCELCITHNTHKNYYQTVKQYLNEQYMLPLYPIWENNEAEQRAIETGEIWEMQWYPNTPVNFFKIAAPTLNELLKLAKNYE